MAMTPEDGAPTAWEGKGMGKEGPAKKKNAILELLGFAGKRRVLAYVGCGLSILNAVLTVMPLVCVWFVVRDLISVYPNWAGASSAAMWAVLAVVSPCWHLVYFGALMARIWRLSVLRQICAKRWFATWRGSQWDISACTRRGRCAA